MLTLNYILKMARLNDQMGELRPGFLLDGKSGLRGPWDTQEPSVKHMRSGGRGKASMGGKYRLVNKLDPKTGDVRIVQEKVSGI